MTLTRQIAELTGKTVQDLTPLHGGDLSKVSCATLADGQQVVIKQGAMVTVEAGMLTALAPYAPKVLHSESDLLLMQYLPEGPTHWRHLGHILRQVHDRPAPRPGWPHDYAFGAVPIANTPLPQWPDFWSERRLRPFIPYVPSQVATRLSLLCQRLPECIPDTPARLLHGDLWSGKLLFSGGQAWLIDPACFYGDPEVDLAMLHLFDTPPAAFWQGYGPTRDGYAQRQPVYQLWPALVHLRLFGAGYLGLCNDLLTRAGV
jgi:fructosamine-3-kinase